MHVIIYYCDCFSSQAYHRDLLEHMPPPVAVIRRPPALPNIITGRNQGKKIPRHGKARRTGSRRQRKASAGNRDSNFF